MITQDAIDLIQRRSEILKLAKDLFIELIAQRMLAGNLLTTLTPETLAEASIDCAYEFCLTAHRHPGLMALKEYGVK